MVELKQKHRVELEPVRCAECDYSRDSDMRCMCSDSQWAGCMVKPDNYCRHGVPRVESK